MSRQQVHLDEKRKISGRKDIKERKGLRQYDDAILFANSIIGQNWNGSSIFSYVTFRSCIGFGLEVRKVSKLHNMYSVKKDHGLNEKWYVFYKLYYSFFYLVESHSLSKYALFSEKLTFLAP